MSAAFDPTTIERALKGDFGKPLEFYDVIDSTNTRALGWAAEGAPDGAVVVAGHQRAGRGRRGREWLSEPGGALLFSVVLRSHLLVAQPGIVTTAVGVAVAEAVEDAAGIEVRLKWPNDVVVGGRKLAGILVEATTGGDAAAGVAGVGINLSWPSGAPETIADRATALDAEIVAAGSDASPERAELLAAVLFEIESCYRRAHEPGGAAEIVRRAAQRSDILGRRVLVRLASGAAIEGEATGLGPGGTLIVETDGGRAEVTAGEVESLRS